MEIKNREYFANRATIRNFADREVSVELIDKMLELAAKAPNTGNMQLYSAVVTVDEEQRRALAPAHFSQPASVTAPALITFCADIHRFERWSEERDAEPGFRNLQGFMAAVFDATILAQQFCTIAEMQGLATCYLGTTAYNAPQIAELLGLPSGVVPLLTVALGYPEAPAEDAGRILPSGFIHHERYSDYSAGRIDEIYAATEAREDSKRFVAENGKRTLAQVFADVRYPKASNEAFSEILLNFLKSSFLNS